MARPSAFTQKAADHICEQMAEGRSLRNVIKTDEGMPALSTVFKWLKDVPEFSEQYARARDLQAEALFEELGEVAEAALNAETAVEVQARRLIVETHKWRLSKIVPKRYGDKLELAGDQQNPLGIAVIERRVIDSGN